MAIISNYVIKVKEKLDYEVWRDYRYARLFREPLFKYKFLPKCSGATLEK